VFDKSIAMELIQHSWPLMVSSFLVLIHLKVDQLMIESYLNMEQVGLYGVAVKLAEFWYFFPAIIVSTLLPYFILLRKRDLLLYKYRLLQLYCAMFWLGVFVAGVTQLSGEWVIVELFGEEYRSSFAPLALNIWAGVFVAQSYAKTIWDVSENLQFYRIISNSVAVFVNVIGNMLLIPVYGIIGAAMATLITRLFNNWIVPLFMDSHRENTLLSIKAINPFFVYKYRLKLNE